MVGMPFWTAAQDVQPVKKHWYNKMDFYAGIEGTPKPAGFSVVYDHKLKKHLGLGAGVLAFDDYANSIVKTAFFADVRGNWTRKRNLFFVHGDAGIDVYHRLAILKGIPNDYPDNTLFIGIGFGYGYAFNKKGNCIYASMKMVNDLYTTKQTNPVNNEVSKVSNLDGTVLFSIGVKL